MRRALVTAAEASGDALVAEVLRALTRRRPDRLFQGIAGPRMARVGADLRALGDLQRLSVSGLVEVLPALPDVLQARRRVRHALHAEPPLALFVDSPSLHLPLAAEARRLGVPSALLVAPQTWAWRPGRASRLNEQVDRLLCLLPFEVEPLRRLGVDARFVGHPAACLRPGPLRGGPPRVLAVLPGSRRGEVRRLLHPLLAAARALPGGPSIRVPWALPEPPPSEPGVSFERCAGATVLADADLALVAAGTATLEAALLAVPTVVVARVHPLTAVAARRLLRVDSVALPNLVLGRPAQGEVVQDLRPLSAATRRLADRLDEARCAARADAEQLRSLLSPGDFGELCADALEDLWRTP